MRQGYTWIKPHVFIKTASKFVSFESWTTSNFPRSNWLSKTSESTRFFEQPQRHHPDPGRFLAPLTGFYIDDYPHPGDRLRIPGWECWSLAGTSRQIGRKATDDEHHDHLIDLTTGEGIEFVDEEIERLQERIAKKLGYELVDHRLELYGRKIKK